MIESTMEKVVFILLLLFPALAHANPMIKFESEIHNFGQVVHGELLEHTFNFTNQGTEDLIIEKLSSS